MCSKKGSKHGGKSFTILLVIGTPVLFMNFMYCHGFLSNKNYVVVLKCPKRMLEYYFLKQYFFGIQW